MASIPPLPTYIHYTELRGEAAQEQLTAQAQRLRLCPGFIDAALLHAKAQGLWLLESRWQAPPPDLEGPSGARAWAFAVHTLIR